MTENNGSIVADVPFIDGFVKSELARACIDIKPYSPNTTPSTPGSSPLASSWYTILGSSPNSIASACRNSPKPSNTFWTVHMIGAFRNVVDSFGCYYSGTNTIFVFNYTIVDAVYNWNQANPSNIVSIDDSKRRTSLHEIGHAFGLEDNVYSDGIMSYQFMFDRLLPVNKAFRLEELRDIQAQPKPQ